MSSISYEIILENNDWKNSITDYDMTVDKCVDKLCKTSLMPDIYRTKDIHINIVLSDNDNIQKLNNNFRNKDKPTNVLSFALIDDDDSEFTIDQCKITKEAIPAGDIIIALETITKEAKEQDKNIKNHFSHMVIHGILHILGYDHINEKDALIMEKIEVEVLDSLNIGNPYK